MSDEPPRPSALEERLAGLRQRLVAGLPERARTVRAATSAVKDGTPDAREELRRAAHKLRGVAATYGLQELTDLAAGVEDGIVRGESDDVVVRAALVLADAIEAAK